MTELRERIDALVKHAAPIHPGTGTDQSVHGGGTQYTADVSDKLIASMDAPPDDLKTLRFGRDPEGRPLLEHGRVNPYGNWEVESTEPPKYLYRAVSNSDYQRIIDQGFIDSAGEMNLGDEGMVAAFQPLNFYLPHIGAGRFIRIDYRPEDGWKVDIADQYVKTHQRVPIDRISMVSPIIEGRFVVERHNLADEFPDVFGDQMMRRTRRFLLGENDQPTHDEFLLTPGDIRRKYGDDYLGRIQKHAGPGIDDIRKRWIAKHGGPGPHSGTGTDQKVHGKGVTSYGSHPETGTIFDDRPAQDRGRFIELLDAKEIFEGDLELNGKTYRASVVREFPMGVRQTSVIVNDSLKVEGEIDLVNADGTTESVGAFTRYLYDNRTVFNDSFNINPDFRGSGIGTMFLSHWEDELAAAGFESMDVTAVNIGRYAWAVAGYDFATNSDRDEAINRLTEEVRQAGYDHENPSWLADAQSVLAKEKPTPLDFALIGQGTSWSGDMHYGKYFMLNMGSGWSGTKPLGVKKFLDAARAVWKRWAENDPRAVEQDDPAFLSELAVSALYISKHAGPGPHPGTMTEQTVHGRSAGPEDDEMDLSDIDDQLAILTSSPSRARNVADWAQSRINQARSHLSGLYTSESYPKVMESRMGSWVQRLTTLYYRARNVEEQIAENPAVALVKHAGPGPHPGTGTPQAIHAGEKHTAHLKENGYVGGEWRTLRTKLPYSIVRNVKMKGVHSTHSGNLVKVLKEGLDPLKSSGGVLGQGIYSSFGDYSGKEVQEMLRGPELDVDINFKKAIYVDAKDWDMNFTAERMTKVITDTLLREGVDLSEQDLAQHYPDNFRERLVGAGFDGIIYSRGTDPDPDWEWGSQVVAMAPESIKFTRLRTLGGHAVGDWAREKHELMSVSVPGMAEALAEEGLLDYEPPERKWGDVDLPIINKANALPAIVWTWADFARMLKVDAIVKHDGPGAHSGTGTPQQVHAGGRLGASASEIKGKKYPEWDPFAQRVRLNTGKEMTVGEFMVIAGWTKQTQSIVEGRWTTVDTGDPDPNSVSTAVRELRKQGAIHLGEGPLRSGPPIPEHFRYTWEEINDKGEVMLLYSIGDPSVPGSHMALATIPTDPAEALEQMHDVAGHINQLRADRELLGSAKYSTAEPYNSMRQHELGMAHSHLDALAEVALPEVKARGAAVLERLQAQYKVDPATEIDWLNQSGYDLARLATGQETIHGLEISGFEERGKELLKVYEKEEIVAAEWATAQAMEKKVRQINSDGVWGYQRDADGNRIMGVGGERTDRRYPYVLLPSDKVKLTNGYSGKLTIGRNKLAEIEAEAEYVDIPNIQSQGDYGVTVNMDRDAYLAVKTANPDKLMVHTDSWLEVHQRALKTKTTAKDKIAKEYLALTNSLRADMAASVGQGSNTPEGLLRTLSEYRDFGGDFQLHNERKTKAVNQINGVTEWMPTDWIEQSNLTKPTLRVNLKSNNRAHYSPSEGILQTDGSRTTLFHELGHRFESSVPTINSLEYAYYRSRTEGESLRPLKDYDGYRHYRSNETTRADKWGNLYSGKDYGGSGMRRMYEVTSMGMGGYANLEQQVTMTYEGASYQAARAVDKDHIEFMLGMLTSA